MNQVSEKKSNSLLQKMITSITDLVSRFFKTTLLVLFLIILILGYFLVIQSQYQDLIKTKYTTLPELESGIASLAANREAMAKYLADGGRFSPAEERLVNLALPDEFDLSSVLLQLDGLARKNNFVLAQTDINENTAKNKDQSTPLKEVMININLAGGDYNDLLSFIGDVEKSLMFLNVNSIRFVGRSNAATGYELVISAYYYSTKK